MKEWIKENGGALFVVAAIVGIGVGGLNYLDRINDGVNENREELRALREEQRATRDEQRETREELRSEIREIRGAIRVLRVEMNDGFVHVYDRVEESDKETTRRMDAANGRIDAANGRIDDVNGLNVDTNRRIDELSGQINFRNDPANVVPSSGEDASGS